MENLMLKDLLIHAEDKLRKEHYAEETIQDYKYVWNKFYNMCELFNVTYFDLNLAKKFLEKYYHINLENGKGRAYTRRMRSIYVLDCINRKQALRLFRPEIDRSIPECFKDIFYEYDLFLNTEYSYSTVHSSENVLTKFLVFIEKIGISAIENIKIQHIYQFINNMATKKYSPNTLYEFKYKLKHFFFFFYNN